MLWYPSRQTRRGTTFSLYSTLDVMALKSQDFDLGPLLSDSLASEGEGQGDHEEHDDWEDVDDQYPSPPPPDPFNEVDSEYPPPPPPDPYNEVDDVSPSAPPPASKRRCTPSLDDVVAAGKHHKSHGRRALKRARKIATEGQVPRASTVRDHILPAHPIHTGLDTTALPAAHGAYAAKAEAKKTEKYGSKKPRTLTELLAKGFHLVRWNGYDPQPLVDVHGRVFAVLVGQPRGNKYAASVAAAYDTITREGMAARFPAPMYKHRRGLFAAINVGISYGKGQSVPSWLQTPYDDLANRLLGNRDITRMATFASAAFAMWAPRLYKYYHEHDTKLHHHLPHLRRLFPRSVFSCAAFNFGPNVWTFKHRDVLNLPFGWCAIQAAGPFDPTKGGHLVLWDLMLVIEFPPGALVLIPSATLSHSNVPVQAGDKRISFTQFTAGGIFRYVDNGFRTEDELAAADPAEYERMMELKSSRWEMGINLFSTLDELVANE
ncbi:hypothetical protein B0H13DRAFT_2217964 [Mycena leptocephala]|nr:hypothetical protein B0H13DRAFT_2217964 [Mycena leptocephala]